MSDRNSWFGFTASQEYAKATYSDYIKQRDEEWIAYLNEHAGESVMSCLFQSKDTLDKLPCAVMCIPLKDELAAERRLQSLLYSTPKRPKGSVHREPATDYPDRNRQRYKGQTP